MVLRHRPLCFAASVLALLLAGCTGGQDIPSYSVATGGHPDRGQAAIVKYRCGSCHTIPGVHDANGVFAPPLTFMASRTFIAGEFPNDSSNLIHWIMSPQSMKPKTAMPQLGLSEPEARDVTAYLYTLH